MCLFTVGSLSRVTSIDHPCVRLGWLGSKAWMNTSKSHLVPSNCTLPVTNIFINTFSHSTNAARERFSGPVQDQSSGVELNSVHDLHFKCFQLVAFWFSERFCSGWGWILGNPLGRTRKPGIVTPSCVHLSSTFGLPFFWQELCDPMFLWWYQLHSTVLGLPTLGGWTALIQMEPNVNCIDRFHKKQGYVFKHTLQTPQSKT